MSPAAVLRGPGKRIKGVFTVAKPAMGYDHHEPGNEAKAAFAGQGGVSLR